MHGELRIYYLRDILRYWHLSHASHAAACVSMLPPTGDVARSSFRRWSPVARAANASLEAQKQCLTWRVLMVQNQPRPRAPGRQGNSQAQTNHFQILPAINQPFPDFFWERRGFFLTNNYHMLSLGILRGFKLFGPEGPTVGSQTLREG